MRKVLSLLLGAGILLGAVLGAEYYAFQRTEIQFQETHVSGLSTSGVEVTLVVEAENPTPIGTTISEQYLEVYMGKNHVATVDRQTTLILPGGDSRLLKYPTTLDVGGTLQALVERIGAGETTVRVQGQYTFASRWLGLEFKVPVQRKEVYVEN